MPAPLRALAVVTALVTAFLLAAPPRAVSYTQTNPALGLDQRHVRVHDNFGDAQAQSNTTPHPSFPHRTGAELAIWKASVEWGSVPHGNGEGDPHQPGGLGSGGANFDPTWQGSAPGPGGLDSNTHSELSGGQSGVLAFTESPTSDGWRIRYYSDWTWSDDPATPAQDGGTGTTRDLQGIATHEYGHAIGLGHSDDPKATMFATTVGTGHALRSIEQDDRAGVQSIYGAMAPTKPRITGTVVAASILTLEGRNFAPEGNEVWFTRADGAAGGPLVVGALASTQDGMRIQLTVPAGAAAGDVLVRTPGSHHAALSNAWPLDPWSEGTSGGPPVIHGVIPSEVEAVVVGDTVVALEGEGFATAEAVVVDSVTLGAGAFATEGDNRLTFELPQLATLGAVEVRVTNAAGLSAPSTLVLVPPAAPVIELADEFLFSTNGLDVVLGADVGDVMLLLVSPLLEPTEVPGILSLQIGGGLPAALLVLEKQSVPPAGWFRVEMPLSGLPFGTPLHLQAAVFDLSAGALPLVPSNVQSGTFYY